MSEERADVTSILIYLSKMFFGFDTDFEDKVICSSHDCKGFSRQTQLAAREKNNRDVNNKFEPPDDIIECMDTKRPKGSRMYRFCVNFMPAKYDVIYSEVKCDSLLAGGVSHSAS
jgi:hypothetical protein